jgi:hypothetical protein
MPSAYDTDRRRLFGIAAMAFDGNSDWPHHSRERAQ